MNIADMPEHRWLVKMGMLEQAKYFSSFGIRFSKLLTESAYFKFLDIRY